MTIEQSEDTLIADVSALLNRTGSISFDVCSDDRGFPEPQFQPTAFSRFGAWEEGPEDISHLLQYQLMLETPTAGSALSLSNSSTNAEQQQPTIVVEPIAEYEEPRITEVRLDETDVTHEAENTSESEMEEEGNEHPKPNRLRPTRKNALGKRRRSKSRSRSRSKSRCSKKVQVKCALSSSKASNEQSGRER